MTDAHDTETLAEVLAAHWEIDVIEGFYTCDCGRVLGENGVTPGDEVDPRHRAHVAEALASRIVQARAGEAMRAVTTLAMQFRQRGLDEAARQALDFAQALASSPAEDRADAWDEGYRAAMTASIGLQGRPHSGAQFPADALDHNPYRPGGVL